MKSLVLAITFVLNLTINKSLAYKHVILMHGLFGSPLEFFKLENFIQKTHPGTTVSAINAYDAISSLEPMWSQTKKVSSLMSEQMKNHPEGVHLICYSQGGLVCRAVLQTLSSHNVHTFVSLSSPQGGQYGDTKFFKYLFPHLLKEELYKFFYTSKGQKWSIGNYWNDPYHQKMYYKESQFLAVLNNESADNHTLSQYFKKNFLRIKKLVLIGGPDDEVITPWQSSHFATYGVNETVLEMKKHKWYSEDSFGLQTLDRRGDVIVYNVPGPVHLNWPRNYTVYQNCIEKWLD